MNFQKLTPLGWSNFFFQQLDFEILGDENYQVFRISAIHRDVIKAIGEGSEQSLICPVELRPVSQFIAVGDWVLAQKSLSIFSRLPKDSTRSVLASRTASELNNSAAIRLIFANGPLAVVLESCHPTS